MAGVGRDPSLLRQVRSTSVFETGISSGGRFPGMENHECVWLGGHNIMAGSPIADRLAVPAVRELRTEQTVACTPPGSSPTPP